jgi:hypothetical protein
MYAHNERLFFAVGYKAFSISARNDGAGITIAAIWLVRVVYPKFIFSEIDNQLERSRR